MSTRKYHENELTTLERAAIVDQMEAMKTGHYASFADLRTDQRNPAMSLRGPLGDLFRHLQEQKMARTQEAGYRLTDYDPDKNTPQSAVARAEYKDGKLSSIEVEQTDISNPLGLTKEEVPQEREAGKPWIETLPGGQIVGHAPHGIQPLPYPDRQDVAQKPAPVPVKILPLSKK